MTQGTPFRFVRDAALSPRQGTPFRFIRDAALTTRQGTPFRFTRGAPIVTGLKAKQVTTGTFSATALARSLFGAGVFDLITSDIMFGAGAISTTKFVDTFLEPDGSIPMSGDLVMGTNKVTGLLDGTISTDAITKGQLDVATGGVAWKEPVAVRELVGSATIATINGLSPTLGDAYVASDAGTPTAGTSDALVAGSITEYNGASWIEIVAGSGGFPPNEARALAAIQTALNGTIGLTDGVDDGKLLQWDGTSLTPSSETTQLDGDTVLISGDTSIFENLLYAYSGTAPSGTWIQFYGANTAAAGAGLTTVGIAFAIGDIERGIQANADDLELDASEVAVTSGGLKAGSNSWELTIEPTDFAGTGLEDDGADNLRLASQGNGIAGGAGSTLSIQEDTTGGAGVDTVSSTDIAQVTVSVNGVGVDVTRLDGDHLDITFGPTNYTPDSSPPEAADVDDLTSHLKGIDDFAAGFGGIPRQEFLTAENITGTDTSLTDTLNNIPISDVSVELYLNGLIQEQGAGLDYTISGTTITWLASTGTAINMIADDKLTVVYES